MKRARMLEFGGIFCFFVTLFLVFFWLKEYKAQNVCLFFHFLSALKIAKIIPNICTQHQLRWIETKIEKLNRTNHLTQRIYGKNWFFLYSHTVNLIFTLNLDTLWNNKQLVISFADIKFKFSSFWIFKIAIVTWMLYHLSQESAKHIFIILELSSLLQKVINEMERIAHLFKGFTRISDWKAIAKN